MLIVLNIYLIKQYNTCNIIYFIIIIVIIPISIDIIALFLTSPMEIKKKEEERNIMENKAYLIFLSFNILKSQAEMRCPCVST